MSPQLIAIGGVFRKDALKMLGVEHDHMIRGIAIRPDLGFRHAQSVSDNH